MGMINSVDVQATCCLLANIALETSVKQNLAEGRNKLNTVCQSIVQANNVANCEALQFLPLYIMGMLKSPAFRGANEISADLRTYIWMRLESLTVSQHVAYYYPRLMALHNLSGSAGEQDESGRVVLPEVLNLTKDVLTQDGIYLLEDGEAILIWIGRAADTNILQAVFGNGNIDELDATQAEAIIGTAGDPLSNKIGMILRQVRTERAVPYMQLHIMKSGDGQKELRFFASLIEDASVSMRCTYMEFLTRMGYRPPTQAAPPAGATPGATPGMMAPPGMRR